MLGVVTTTVCGRMNSKSTRSKAARRGGSWCSNDFHHSRGVETGQPLVSISQRSVNQANTVLLHRRQIFQAQFPRSDLQCAMRYIHAKDFREGFVLQELSQKPTFAAAEVQNTLRAAGAKRCHHCSHALFCETNWFLNGLFLARVSFGHFIRCGFFLTNETTQSFTGQALLMFQVAIRN